MSLSTRQQAILKAIVEDYILTAEPVGSRLLAKKFDFGLSPATLRNEMADLEDEGFLRQPHTSAGRIPSDAGYRIFVDVLMERPGDLPPEELRVLERFSFDARDLNEILAQTAKVTAVLSQCTAIVRAPRLNVARIQFLQLVPVTVYDVMLVMLTDRGTSMSQLVQFQHPLESGELAVLTNFLNAHLLGRPLDSLTGKLLSRMRDEMGQYEAVIRTLWQRLTASPDAGERVFVSNASFLAQQPEFDNTGKLRALLHLLEREQTLASALAASSGTGKLPGVHVAIGHENLLPDLHECTMISAPYRIGGQIFGEIGVMGPTRLGYSRAITAVETMARHLSHTLTRLFVYQGR